MAGRPQGGIPRRTHQLALLDYLHAYNTVSEAQSGLARYIEFFNTRRAHTALDRRTLDAAYFDAMPLAAPVYTAELNLSGRDKLSKFAGPSLRGARDHRSLPEVAQIARTVHRTPQAMVKVLTRGAARLGAVRQHRDYIGRKGEVELETDDGRSPSSPDAADGLPYEWNPDLEQRESRTDLPAETGKAGRWLVGKLASSMSAGTPADRALAATRNFIGKEFALEHRYAMARHIDEPHPHVHVVLKAVSEMVKRLHIRKATLRE